MALKQLFHIDSECLRSRDSNPTSRSLGILAIFAIFRILIFFLNREFFLFSLCKKFYFFLMKLQILRVLRQTSLSGLVDKIRGYHAVGHAFESRSTTVFYFPTRKYFTI